jgi:hypothetical protein
MSGGAAQGRGESSAPRSGRNQRQSPALDHTTYGCRDMNHSLNCNDRGVDRGGGRVLASWYQDGACAKLARGVVGTHDHGNSAGASFSAVACLLLAAAVIASSCPRGTRPMGRRTLRGS